MTLSQVYWKDFLMVKILYSKALCYCQAILLLTHARWKNILQPFVEFYSYEISCCHGVESELHLWSKMWEDQWKSHWKAMNEQHLHTIGANLTLTTAEISKLKNNAVPNSIASIP